MMAHSICFFFSVTSCDIPVQSLESPIGDQIITEVFTKMVVHDISRSQHNMSDCDGIPDSSEQMCVCVSGFKAVCVSGLSQSFSDLTSPLKFEVFPYVFHICSTVNSFWTARCCQKPLGIGLRDAQKKKGRILQRLFAPGWLLRLECQLSSWEGTGYVLI